MFGASMHLGIDIGASGMKLVAGRKNKAGFQIVHYASLPVKPAAEYDKSSLGLADSKISLTELMNSWRLKRQRAVFSVHGPDIYAYSFSLPRLHVRTLKRAAALRATTVLPLPIEQLTYDVAILPDEPLLESVTAVFVAARRSYLLELAKTVQAAGLKPVAADLAILALKRSVTGIPAENALGFVNSGTITLGLFSGAWLKQVLFFPASGSGWRLAGAKTGLYAETGSALQAVYQANPALNRKLYLAVSALELQRWQTEMRAFSIEVCPVELSPEVMEHSEVEAMDASYYIAVGLALRGGR